MRKKILIFLGIVVVVLTGYYVYFRHINHNLTEISEGKVYSSGVIPPDEIESYVKKLKIKTIVDLRDSSVQDELNPALEADIQAERKAVEAIDGVEHINIPTLQIPKDKAVDDFIEVMSDSTNYPVLIHCYHGTGRAVLFSALYRIEFEDFSNDEARRKTRYIVPFSNFDKDSEKGQYLLNYEKRRTE